MSGETDIIKALRYHERLERITEENGDVWCAVCGYDWETHDSVVTVSAGDCSHAIAGMAAAEIERLRAALRVIAEYRNTSPDGSQCADIAAAALAASTGEEDE